MEANTCTCIFTKLRTAAHNIARQLPSLRNLCSGAVFQLGHGHTAQTSFPGALPSEQRSTWVTVIRLFNQWGGGNIEVHALLYRRATVLYNNLQ